MPDEANIPPKIPHSLVIREENFSRLSVISTPNPAKSYFMVIPEPSCSDFFVCWVTAY